MNLQHLQVAHAFQAQITAATSYLQPISDNQAAACVFATYDFPYHPQSAPSSRTSNTSSVLQTLRSLLSRGNQAPGPAVSYSSQLCLHSIALAWYARILSTILAFYFSSSFYLTFKVGHQWRTEHLFCLPISSDAGWNVPMFIAFACACVCVSVSKLQNKLKKYIYNVFMPSSWYMPSLFNRLVSHAF